MPGLPRAPPRVLAVVLAVAACLRVHAGKPTSAMSPLDNHLPPHPTGACGSLLNVVERGYTTLRYNS